MTAYFAHSPETHPRWFAHRGGASEHPENTLLAFEHAVALGYQYLELDVHVSADQHWVVLHDATLERTTSGRGNVADFRLEQLKTLDAGYQFAPERGYPWRGRGLTIPTLDEVVALGVELCFNVDIKENRVTQARYSPKALATRFWQYASEKHLEERLLIASSTLTLARSIRAVSQGRALTSASKPEAWAFLAHVHAGLPLLGPHYRALQVPPDYGLLRVATPHFIERAHEKDIEVHLWTLDDPLVAQLYLNMGVDGIMTDCPTAMLSLKAR